MAYENDWQKAWSKQLKNNLVNLTTNLDVTGTNLVLDSLTEKDVLSEEEADAVRVEKTSTNKNRRFISFLRLKDKKQIQLVIDAVSVSQKPMANILQALLDNTDKMLGRAHAAVLIKLVHPQTNILFSDIIS